MYFEALLLFHQKRRRRSASNFDSVFSDSMELGRFRFRDHLVNEEQFDSETSSQLSSVSSDGGDESEPESMTGKGIKRLCAELVELKNASDEEFHKNVYADSSAFLRIFEEARALESDVAQLRNNLVVEKRLVQKLADGIYLNYLSEGTIEAIVESENDDEKYLISKLEAHTDDVLEKLDSLLCEQRLDEALCVLEMEEVVVERMLSEEEHDMDVLAFYNLSVSGRKAMLAKKFSVIAYNPRVNGPELQVALIGLRRLGERQLATQLLLRHYGSRMKKGIQFLKSSKSHLNDLYVKELSKFVFSTISQSAKCFVAVNGDIAYAAELIEWAHQETAMFAACFNEYVESFSEAGGGLSIATESFQIAMSFCLLLENQSIVLQPYLIKHVHPSLEKVLDAQLRHFKLVIGIFTSGDTWELSRYAVSGILSKESPMVSTEEELEYCLLTSSGRKFLSLLQAVIKNVDLLFTFEMGSSIIKGLTNLFMEYNSIVEGAMNVTNKIDGPDEGGSINVAAESVLQQVSILLNMSTVQYFFSNFLTSAVHDIHLSNFEATTSNAVDCLEKQLRECILRVKETYAPLKCHLFRRFKDLPMSVEYKLLSLTGSCKDEAYNSPVYHGTPSANFQILFLELRKLEDFSEENAIDDDWLMELLTDLIEAVFVSISDVIDTWMSITREDAEAIQDVAHYTQLALDIQFVVEIATYEGCLTDDLQVASTTLMSQLQPIAVTAELAHNRELSHIPLAVWATDSATKSIQMLLESHTAKPVSNDRYISSLEEPYNESPNGSSCFNDDLSSSSEKSDELEDSLETEVKEVTANALELSLTRPNIKDNDASPLLRQDYLSLSFKNTFEDPELENAVALGDTSAFQETLTPSDKCHQ